MILSGKTIEQYIQEKKIVVDPAPIIKEASIKIHLSNQFSQAEGDFETRLEYILEPKEFILGRSKEKITLPENIAGLYDGYTHLARRGIITHLSSMFVDPGTDGYITFEIFNASDQEVLLEAGMRVGHLVFLEVK